MLRIFQNYVIIGLNFVMQKKIRYNLKVSKRARRMRLEIRNNGNVSVIAPLGIDYSLVERFIFEKSKWIIDKLNYFKSISGKIFLGTSNKEYIKYREKARLLAENRISHYNKLYNFNINRISI